MTWHSAARHTPEVDYAQITGTPDRAEYDILPPIKTGKKVYFGGGDMTLMLNSSGPSFGFGLGLDYPTLPVIRCMNCEPGNGSAVIASVTLLIIGADGKEYVIGQDELDEPDVPFVPKIGSIILQEGEGIRLLVGAVSGVPIVESVVPYAEVNGPVVTRRVQLDTEEWRDLIPSPRPGKVNVFINNDVSRPGLAQLMEEGTSPDAEVAIRRVENGSPVTEVVGGTFDEGIINAPPTLIVLDGFPEAGFVNASIRANQSLQARINDFDPGGEEGKHIFVSYLEIDEDAF